LFNLDDKSAVFEARLDEALLEAHRSVLREDELLIVQGRTQPDRYSGGMMLLVQQLWDLPAARCRFGKYLRVAVNGTVPRVHELLAEFPPRREVLDDGEERLRGLPLRFRVERHAEPDALPAAVEPTVGSLRGVRFELALNDAARTYPSDAALAHWSAQAAEGLAEVVYE
jgi:DNA polymerase-3 subunit alpha